MRSSASDKTCYRQNTTNHASVYAQMQRGQRRSDLYQGVAPTFTTPRSERQRVALPVLRRILSSVRTGTPLLEALLGVERMLAREFARSELVRILAGISLGLTLHAVDRERDPLLTAWLVRRAIGACRKGATRKPGGGWRVTH